MREFAPENGDVRGRCDGIGLTGAHRIPLGLGPAKRLFYRYTFCQLVVRLVQFCYHVRSVSNHF